MKELIEKNFADLFELFFFVGVGIGMKRKRKEEVFGTRFNRIQTQNAVRATKIVKCRDY